MFFHGEFSMNMKNVYDHNKLNFQFLNGFKIFLNKFCKKIIGAMETPQLPQHGNGPKSEFGSVSFFFQELSEIP